MPTSATSDSYQPRPENKFTFGLWTVGRLGGDPWGEPVRKKLAPTDLVKLIAEVGAWGVNLHDNDLVPIDASAADRDKLIREFKKTCEGEGITVAMVACNLFADPAFRDGAFTSNHADVRAFALQKAMGALDIGAALGAKIFAFWGGREGIETDAAKDPRTAFARIRDAINFLCDYSLDQNYGYRIALEAKPNEPRGQLYFPVTASYLGFIPTLAHPEMIGVNPEFAHEIMVGLDVRHSVAQALDAGKLFHIDLNDQRPGRFDEDLRFASANPRMAFWVVKTLEDAGYDGPRHFDAHAYRTSDYDGVRAFARGCMRNYLILKERAARWSRDPRIRELLEQHTDGNKVLGPYTKENVNALRALIRPRRPRRPEKRGRGARPAHRRNSPRTTVSPPKTQTAPRAQSPSHRHRQDPIEEAYARSIDQLKRNVCPYGFLASPIDRRNYRAVWSRDGCICAVAAYVSGDEELINHARHTLRTLAEHQADNGQVPSYLLVAEDDEIRHANYGGWGEITSIDSSLWFLIACQTAFMRRKESEFIDDPLFETYRRVFRYLFAIDANSCGLLEIPIAGDWTDILNRSYHVLYDEVLWYRALRSGARLAEHADEGHDRRYYDQAARRVRERLNDEFWWDNGDVVARVAKRYKIRHDLPKNPDFHFYQSHLTPFLNDWHQRFDAFANVLAGLLGVASPERTDAIIRQVCERKLAHPYPLRVLDPPIEAKDPDAYGLLVSQEPPYEYHNGGIWPLAGGFWVMLLSLVGKKDDAHDALHRLACALRLPATDEDQWGFYEHLHGQTGEAMGTRDLTWNGAAYLLAYHAVVENQYPAFTEHEDCGAGPEPQPAK